MNNKCEVCNHEHEGELCLMEINPDGDNCCCDAYMYDYDEAKRDCGIYVNHGDEMVQVGSFCSCEDYPCCGH